MIARLRGRAVANTPEGLVVDVAGVGYLVAATPSAVRKADGADEVALHTYLHVREDALQLYGFAEAAERELFLQLLSVNGVGICAIQRSKNLWMSAGPKRSQTACRAAGSSQPANPLASAL